MQNCKRFQHWYSLTPCKTTALHQMLPFWRPMFNCLWSSVRENGLNISVWSLSCCIALHYVGRSIYHLLVRVMLFRPVGSNSLACMGLQAGENTDCLAVCCGMTGHIPHNCQTLTHWWRWMISTPQTQNDLIKKTRQKKKIFLLDVLSVKAPLKRITCKPDQLQSDTENLSLN